MRHRSDIHERGSGEPRADPSTVAPLTVANGARSFAPIAASLRAEMLAAPGLDPASAAGRLTIDTNSDLVERRAQPLVEIAFARRRSGAAGGRRVIDLGCGLGGLAAYFAFIGAQVVGVDVKSERLEIGRRVASRHGLDVELRPGRMESLEAPDASFDVAVMNNSLVYVTDRDTRVRALGEALRVLVPGGVLIMRNANRLHPIDQFTGLPLIHLLPPAAAVRAAGRLGRPRSHCRLLSPAATRRELLAAGFAEPVHHATSDRRVAPLELLARYTHFSALRA